MLSASRSTPPARRHVRRSRRQAAGREPFATFRPAVDAGVRRSSRCSRAERCSRGPRVQAPTHFPRGRTHPELRTARCCCPLLTRLSWRARHSTSVFPSSRASRASRPPEVRRNPAVCRREGSSRGDTRSVHQALTTSASPWSPDRSRCEHSPARRWRSGSAARCTEGPSGPPCRPAPAEARDST